MFYPDIEKSQHFQWLLVPGIVGLLLFTTSAPGFPWWVGVGLYPVVALAYLHLYSICFPPEFSKNTFRGWVLSVALVLFQIGYWAAIFLIAQHIYRNSLAQ